MRKSKRVSSSYLDQVPIAFNMQTETLLRLKEGTISSYIGQYMNQGHYGKIELYNYCAVDCSPLIFVYEYM